MHNKPLKVNLLGTPEITWNSDLLALQRRQARALLYYLAAHGQPVSRDALLLLLWSEVPESTARRNLTRLLSYLRSALPLPEILHTTRAGILLNQDLSAVDAVDFVRLSTEDNHLAWETAVDLVRGPFLDGFALPGSSEYDRWLSLMQQQFEQQHLGLLSKLVAAKTAVSDYAAAIRFARQYLEIDDLAEEIHRQLITLYLDNGQRSAALGQYENCMVVLERELGVEPLPETRKAYEAALDGRRPRQTPVIPQPVWNTLPSLDLPLTGRDVMWQNITHSYDRFRSGGVILLSGNAGVGKSRLMQEFALAQEGLVLSGNAYADGQTLPYQPLIQMLRQSLPLHDRWRQTGAIWLSETSRLLPELPDYFPNLPQLVDVEAQQAQARLFEAVTRLFCALAVDEPLLLCFDDVQWADESTLGWLQYAASQLNDSGICIFAAYRSGETVGQRGWQRAVARNGRFSEVHLAGMTKADIAAFLQKVDPQIREPGDLALSIYNATGGNTFFVLETIRELLETGQIDQQTIELPLPPTVRDAVLRRAGRLTPLAKQILEVTAVLSPTLIVEVISAVAGRDEMETAGCLEELVAHHFLSDGGQLGFQHALARDAVYQDLSDWRRQLLHRRSAKELAELMESENGLLAMVADHYAAAGDLIQGIEYYRRAATAAKSLYAHGEAISYLRKAIDLTSRVEVETAVLAQLYEELADTLAITGEFPVAEETYRVVLAMTSESEALKSAELERKIGATLPPQQREDEAETLFRAALARLEGAPAQADYHVWQSTRLNIILGLLDALYFQLRSQSMTDLNDQAKLLLDEVGTSEQKALYYTRLNQQTYIKHRYRLPDKNVELSIKSLAFARESGDVRLIARQQFHLGFVSLWCGKLDEAQEMLHEALKAAEAQGDSWLQNQAMVYLTIVYRFQGARAKAEDLLPQLVEVSRLTGNSMYGGVAQANTAWLHFRAGDWRQAKTQAEMALASWEQTSYPFQWLAQWVLLAVALQHNWLADAVSAASAMLDQKQMKLVDEVEIALETAVAAWESEDEDAACKRLESAVKLAGRHGYL